MVHEKKEREEKFAKKMQEIEKRKYFGLCASLYRMEQLERDGERWKRMDEEEKKDTTKVAKLKDTNQAGKKNMSSAAYNPLTLEYDKTTSGTKLKESDESAKYRAQLRSHNIDSKSNSGYNILTGAERTGVTVSKPAFLPPGPPPASKK